MMVMVQVKVQGMLQVASIQATSDTDGIQIGSAMIVDGSIAAREGADLTLASTRDQRVAPID